MSNWLNNAIQFPRLIAEIEAVAGDQIPLPRPPKSLTILNTAAPMSTRHDTSQTEEQT